jgi:hypothetical protein
MKYPHGKGPDDESDSLTAGAGCERTGGMKRRSFLASLAAMLAPIRGTETAAATPQPPIVKEKSEADRWICADCGDRMKDAYDNGRKRRCFSCWERYIHLPLHLIDR